MWQIVWSIVCSIGLVGICFSIKKFIGWIWPLDINVGSKNLKIIELRGGIPLEVYMPIGFTNRTSSKFDVTFSSFDFNSEKNIEGITFGIKKGIFEEPNLRRHPKTNLSLDLGNESHYLCIKINLLKNYKWKEFLEYIKEYENTSMILKFDYSIATNFKNKTFKKKIKGFFSGLIKSTKEFGSG